MAIRNIFLVSRVWVLCAFMLLIALTAAPSFAGTQIGNQRQQVCNVIIEYPSHMEFGLENATCDQNGNLVGQHSISITVDLAIRNQVSFTFDSDFLNGRLNGLTSIQTDAGFSFDGEIFQGGRTVGRTVSFDGSVVEGETRGGVSNLTGTVTSRNGQVSYYINGRESEASAFADNQSPSPSSSKVSLPEATPALLIISEMTTVDLGQSQFCLADLPTAQYKITGDFSGRCKDQYYTGKAKLTLTPKQGSGLLPMTAIIKYQSGQINGLVDISYTGSSVKYKGTMQNWAPVTGTLSEPIGNDEYRVVDIAGGLFVAERTEHREPSFGKLLGQNIVHSLATSLQDCLQGRCEQERLAEQAKRDRKAEERRDAQAHAQQQTQIAEQQRQNSVAIQQQTDAYAQQQADWKRESDATIEDARQKQLAGLDRDGKPVLQPVPVQIARNDPPSVFVADTNQAEFSGDTHPQGDPPVIVTSPAELPAPQPAVQGLPDPIRPIENEVPPPLASATRLPEPNAPPVQLGSGGDTLGTDPAPSNPAPQPPPPVVQVANNPSLTPAVNQMTRPTVPYGLAPSGSSSSPAIVTNPIILRWSSVTGTDYYDFGISSEATGYRLVVDQRLRDTFYSGNLTPGKYRWNLRACNSRDECSAYAGQEYFEIAGAVTNQPSNTQSTLSAPTQLYPTNQGELAFPVPIEWNRVTGATSYKVAVRDVTDNILIANDEVVASNTFTPRNQKAGHSYVWDVQACNQTGCSVRSRNASFRTAAAKSDSCKIEVRFKPVLRISNHAFIITSDSNSTTYFRGGPAMREKTLSEIFTDNSGNRPFGYIVTESGSYSPGTPDWTLSPSGSQIIAMVSGNCDLIDQNFGRTLADIESSKILYDPIYKNSNSVIHEALERAGYKSISPALGAIAWHTRLP